MSGDSRVKVLAVNEALPEVRVVEPRRFRDDRGYFSEVFNERDLRAAGIGLRFIQENHAFSDPAYTLRGIHYQIGEHQQDKLVRVVTGSALDVAVDLRRGSATFGRWASCLLSAENGRQMLVPKGFGHGILSLEPGTHISYFVTAHYSPDHDRGIRFDDPRLAIDWGVDAGVVLLSPRDDRLPTLAESPDLM